jgi:hypothetical protein
MASQAVTLFALVSLSLAPERPLRNPPMPNGPQPEFSTIQAIDAVQKRVEYLQTQVVIVPVAVAAFVEGKQVIKTAYRQEYRTIKRAFSLAKESVYDTEGKKVSAQDALKRLKVGDTVLLATQPVDPLYLRVIRPTTLILVSSTVSAPFSMPVPFPKDKSGEPPPKIHLPKR